MQWLNINEGINQGILSQVKNIMPADLLHQHSPIIILICHFIPICAMKFQNEICDKNFINPSARISSVGV